MLGVTTNCFAMRGELYGADRLLSSRTICVVQDKYGFIFRYKEEWEDVTGYAAESWHIRYVGKEAATQIHKLNIPYEEYYIKYVANKKS